MIALKIQCPCGQRFAFDVEPVEGRMPMAVACPACGADNTAKADQAIAAALAPAPAAGLSLALHKTEAAPPLAVPAEYRPPAVPPLERKTTLEWYEHLWAGLPLALVAVGGLIGGGFGGAAWAINRQVFLKVRNPVLRYLVTGLISGAAVVAWLLVAGTLMVLLKRNK